MALQSKLFRGDPKLEAAAVSDPAHIGPGATGAHVSKIQQALIQLDGISLDADGKYGPATAAAVLAYKQKRNVVNRSYQAQADNIVGRMTIAVLDREMVAKESNDPSENRGRIHCRCFPYPVPALAVSRTSAASAIAPSTAAVPAAAAATPRGEALGRTPGAAKWVAAALNYIRLRKAQLLSGLPPGRFQDTDVRKALDIHFKLFRHPQPGEHLALLERVYLRIATAIGMAEDIFVDDPATHDFANAFLGGFFEPNHPQHGKIRFGLAYAGKGELFQTSVIVHEAAHFVDHHIGHFASELPPLLGTPVDSAKNYHQLTPTEASRNAYTYAQFALHAFKRFDKRIVPFNE